MRKINQVAVIFLAISPLLQAAPPAPTPTPAPFPSKTPIPTFEELAGWWIKTPVDTTNYCSLYAGVTLLITQEDGRTSYAPGGITSFDNVNNTFEGRVDMTFNDRTRWLVNASNTSGYWQPFDKDSSAVDGALFAFHKVATNQFDLQLNLLRWGAKVNVTLTKTAYAKMYTGWGTTIGGGSGLALYSLSINNAQANVNCIN